MMDQTPLDVAHAAMMAAPDDAALRLQFYHCLADTEMYLLLEKEVEGDKITPQVFDLSDTSCVLVFDREDRLADFTGTPTPYAALSGRMIAELLLNKNIDLGVNLEVAPSSIMIPATALSWLIETLRTKPAQMQGTIREFSAPTGVPHRFVQALEARILHSGGVARAAFLVAVGYDTGAKGHLIGFIDTPEMARDALAKSVSETLIFSGLESGAVDVGFFAAQDPTTRELARHGHQFELPKPVEPEVHKPVAPGSNPDAPPILK